MMYIMSREIVPLITGEIYHNYNRGVDKREIFSDTNDYLRFYQSLYLFNSVEPISNFTTARVRHSSVQQKLVGLHAYALLPNHFHMLIEQKVDGGISEFMKRITGGYTSYFNEKYERSGVLFQGRYKKVHVESDEQYRYLLAYVNENHLVHRVDRPKEIMYSSTFHYQGIAKSSAISPTQHYDTEAGQKLGIEIYEKRLLSKNKLFE